MKFLVLVLSLMAAQVTFAQYGMVSVGTAKAEKFDSSSSFYVGRYDVDSVAIRMTSNDMSVRSVTVEYGNGYSERLYSLERRLRSGDIVYARVDNRQYVSRIRVEATSGLIGSRGRYEVLIETRGHGRPDRPGRPGRPGRYELN